MKRIAVIAVLGAALLGTGQAEARGCIRGALVGGIAGHFAGHHGLMGAAAGCAVGHHYANKKAATPATTSDQAPTAPAQ